MACGCSQHEQYPEPGQAEDSLSAGWLAALAASLLLIGMVPQPAYPVTAWVANRDDGSQVHLGATIR